MHHQISILIDATAVSFFIISVVIFIISEVVSSLSDSKLKDHVSDFGRISFILSLVMLLISIFFDYLDKL